MHGEEIEASGNVTTEANGFMAQVHNSKKRIPTMLDEDLGYEWMFGKLSEKRITEIGRLQFSAEKMEACTIAKDFQSALDPVAPFVYEDLPALEVAV